MPVDTHDTFEASGRFRERPDVPGVDTFGEWRPFRWRRRDGSEQEGVRLKSAGAPWRRLFAALDATGASLAADVVSPVDEADAIVAACWLHGSYAHVLTFGEFYPPFRVDRGLSRLRDDEMQRIQVEFSAGLAAWWADRAADPPRVNRRARAALRYLPIPWRAGRATPRDEAILEWARSAAEHLMAIPGSQLPGPRTLRHEANALVDRAYRNDSPLEGLHAGRRSLGSEVPGFVRFYSDEVRRLGRLTADRVACHRIVRDMPEVGEILQRVHGLLAPANWSLTEESASVEFLGMPGGGSLEPRLRYLARRYPQVYGWISEPLGTLDLSVQNAGR